MTRDEYTLRCRETARRGMELPWAKLTDADVKQAREAFERGQFAIAYIRAHYSAAGLARKYGVSRSAMDKALKGITWGHV
jgi:predicted DNA binding protein